MKETLLRWTCNMCRTQVLNSVAEHRPDGWVTYTFNLNEQRGPCEHIGHLCDKCSPKTSMPIGSVSIGHRGEGIQQP